MTAPRSVEDRIALWLEEEAEGRLPDRVLAATFERSRVTRQASGRSIWRAFPMSRPIPTMIAVGAAVILVAVGVSLLASRAQQPNVGVSVSATPTPTEPPLGLALVDVDGTIRQELQLPRDAWMADLSGDGTRVAFTTSDFNFAFCGACGHPRHPTIVEIGGRGKFLYPDVNERVAEIANLAWSPDGTSLAYAAPDDAGNVDIYVATWSETSEPVQPATARRLTTDPAIDQFPAWSPDGSTIYYDNAGAGLLDDAGFSPTQEIWRVPVAGGDPVRLTNDNEPDSQPDVGPDGTVAYWHAGDIWKMAADGSGQIRFTTIPIAAGFSPRWSPDGSRIALLRYDASERARMPGELKLPVDLPLLEVIVVDVVSGAVTDVGVRVPSDVNPVSWTPDGQALLIYRYDVR